MLAIVTWDGGAGTSNWNDAANWDTDTLPGASDDAVIPDLSGTPTITHSSGSHTIASLTSSEGFALSGGTLIVNGTLSFAGTFTLSGGAILRNANVEGNAGALLQVTSSSGTLDGVTLGVNTTLRQGATGSGNQVTVLNNLTLNGVTLRLERLRTGDGAFNATFDVGLNFSGGAQTLGGTGQVELFSALDNNSREWNVRVRPTGGGSLTIAPGITVRNATNSKIASVGDSTLPLIIEGTVSARSPGQTLRINGSTVTNRGTLESLAGELDVNGLAGNLNATAIANGDLDLSGTYTINQPVSIPAGSGSLTLRGAWKNDSTITQSGGTVRLGSTFRVADLGTFVGAAGTVSVFGTLDDPGATLRIDTGRIWQVDGGMVRGVTVAGGAGALLEVAAGGGTLDAVTLAVNTTLRQGATGSGNQVTVLNGLTLDGVVLRLERPDRSGADSSDVGLNFSGGAQTLGGTGALELFSALVASTAEKKVRVRPTGGGSLTIGAGITVRNATNSWFTVLGDPTLPLIIEGTVSAQSSGQSLGQALRLTGSTVTNRGTIQMLSHGILEINRSVVVDGSATLGGPGSGAIIISGSLTGDTRNGDFYNPRGTVRLNGSGTAANPRLLEVMGRDLGNRTEGFTRNFAYGTLALANNTYVRLVDLADNAPGSEAEALYVSTLVVPAGTTLDLNGLRVYVRAMQLDGTVTGGAVTWVPDGDTLAFAAPTPGVVATVGEVDPWQFFRRRGRAVTVVVNPGSTEPSPLTPRLDFALVQFIDPEGNVLASGSSTSSGAVVTLRDVVLPADGTYTVRIGAAAAQPGRTGSYLVTLWDSTTDVAALMLGRSHIGGIETPFSQDRWVFSAAAGQQVRFDLVGNAAPGTTFTLTGPAGFVGFTNLTDDSDLVTLTQSGTYILTAAAGPAGLTGAYTFQVVETSLVDLTLGTPAQGLLAGIGQAQLFRVIVREGKPLRVNLDDSSTANRNEVYVKFGAPPTRADFQFRSSTLAANQQVLVPNAAPGSWFILIYAAAVAVPGPFTITAKTGDVMLGSVTPDYHGNGGEAVLTLTGVGFTGPMTVELVAAGGASFPAAAVQVNLPTQLTARFPAGAVPAGVYTIRAGLANGATSELPNAFRMEAGGAAQFTTELILPKAVGRHQVATIYVEYSNAGTVAMPAPLLVLRGSDGALMTLDQSRVVAGFWTSAVPEGFGDTVQFLGSGATPGMLQPGERLRVPVYYAGLLRPWDFGDTSVRFTVESLEAETTIPIDWASLKDDLRLPSISVSAWDAVYANLVAQVGSTWGDYVRTLDENAAYLGRLGQHVVDVSDLWAFEVQQAIGLGPVTSLAGANDLMVAAPGLDITFRRVFSSSVVGRHDQGPLGRGWFWADGWERTLFLEPDGTVLISAANCGCAQAQPRGLERRFEPDSRRAATGVAQPGNHSGLTALPGGAYQLREPDGSVTRFRSDGRVDSVEDPNGNRITATWTGSLLTRLTHSAGQFLQISYTATGLIERLDDSLGRTVAYAYDASGGYLTEVTGLDGQTTRYTYATGGVAAREHALLSVESSNATHGFFTYDPRGRLESMALDGNAERVNFAYDSAGGVTVTDATGGATTLFFDHRGLVAALENALGRRTILGYDGDFNLTRLTDAIGQDYTYAYDTRGNLIRSTDPLGQTTSFSYTRDFNRLASMTDARGNSVHYAYDSRGNLTSIRYADGSVEWFTSDSHGEVDTRTNRRGQVIDFHFNADGRLERRELPGGSFVEYQYDARGNLAQALTPEGTTQFEYLDPLNPDQPTRITYPNGRFLVYTYQNGRRTSLVHPDGFTVNYQYDVAGRLASLRDGSGNRIVEYHYDAAGRLERRTNGNGTSAEYQYDAAGHIEHLINRAADNSVNSRFDYVYDALGRRTRMTTLEGVWNYTYDGISQLTRAGFTSNHPGLIPHQDLAYVYDAAGNRVRTVINGVTTEYTTNNLNQYIQVGPIGYTYDRDGNLVARVEGAVNETFTYDALNRLVGVATLEGVWGSEYDALGYRSATIQDGQRTEFLVDPLGLGDVVAEYTGGTTLAARYLHAFSNLVSRVDGAGPAS